MAGRAVGGWSWRVGVREGGGGGVWWRWGEQWGESGSHPLVGEKRVGVREGAQI